MDPFARYAPLLTAAPQEDEDLRPDVAWLADEGEAGASKEDDEPEAFDELIWSSLVSL
jgi:hypothetical protein